MAQKRSQEKEPYVPVDMDAGEGSPEEKRPRLPAYATAIAEALKVHTLQKFCSVLEPLLRKVVNEEVERALEKHIPAKCEPSVPQISGSASRNLQLQFRNRLSLPIFTGSRIEGEQNFPIQVVLIDASTGQIVTAGPESSMKVEIVVLEGDFERNEDEDWTEEDFDNHVVREREGKRPLLNGEMVINLKEGVGILGELSFTDNSSWIRSRKFKLGARITGGCSNGIRIREAKTDSFTVKDHRGELYKKHYPPALHDEVWRLDKIGKDGAFHKRLNNARIYSVLDFLKLVSIDPQRLRNVLGSGMSNKMWEGTVEHAKTCVLDNKLYVYHADKEHTTGIVFNSVCEIIGFLADEQYILAHQLSEAQKPFVNKMIKYAYENWNEVVEYDASALLDNRAHGSPILPGHAELADGQGGQIAFNRVTHQQHCDSLEASNNVWMSSPAENLNFATPSQFAIEGSVQQNIVPQMSSALALGTQRVVINHLQPACDNQNLESYPARNNFRNESIGGMHIRNDYAHQGINDQCGEASISRDNWNGDLYEGSEGFYFSKSGDKLASEWEPLSLDGADLQAQVQSLIQVITTGTSGQPDNSFYNTPREEAFAFSVFTPISDVSFNMSTRRLHGRAYIFWLKLKAALKWGISIRKVAAAKRARIVEIED